MLNYTGFDWKFLLVLPKPVTISNVLIRPNRPQHGARRSEHHQWLVTHSFCSTIDACWLQLSIPCELQTALHTTRQATWKSNINRTNKHSRARIKT